MMFSGSNIGVNNSMDEFDGKKLNYHGSFNGGGSFSKASGTTNSNAPSHNNNNNNSILPSINNLLNNGCTSNNTRYPSFPMPSNQSSTSSLSFSDSNNNHGSATSSANNLLIRRPNHLNILTSIPIESSSSSASSVNNNGHGGNNVFSFNNNQQSHQNNYSLQGLALNSNGNGNNNYGINCLPSILPTPSSDVPPSSLLSSSSASNLSGLQQFRKYSANQHQSQPFGAGPKAFNSLVDEHSNANVGSTSLLSPLFNNGGGSIYYSHSNSSVSNSHPSTNASTRPFSPMLGNLPFTSNNSNGSLFNLDGASHNGNNNGLFVDRPFSPIERPKSSSNLNVNANGGSNVNSSSSSATSLRSSLVKKSNSASPIFPNSINDSVEDRMFDQDYCIDSLLLQDLDIINEQDDQSSTNSSLSSRAFFHTTLNGDQNVIGDVNSMNSGNRKPKIILLGEDDQGGLDEEEKEDRNNYHGNFNGATQNFNNTFNSPTSSFSPSDSFISLKAVMTTKEAGLLIGKGGKTIGEIREKAGVSVKISNFPTSTPGSNNAITSTQFGERLLLVSGPLDRVSKAFHLISLCFKNPEIHLLIPHICMGGIIGRGGKRVRELETISNARIAASTEFINSPLMMNGGASVESSERCVSVIGAPDSIHIAIFHIALSLSKSTAYNSNLISATPLNSNAPPPSTVNVMKKKPNLSPINTGNGEIDGSASNFCLQEDHQGGLMGDEDEQESNNSSCSNNFPCSTLTTNTSSAKVSLIKVVSWLFSQLSEFYPPASSSSPLNVSSPTAINNNYNNVTATNNSNTALFPFPPGVIASSTQFTFVFYFDNKIIGCIIGKNGSTIHAIRMATLCQIKINAVAIPAPCAGIFPSFLQQQTQQHQQASHPLNDEYPFITTTTTSSSLNSSGSDPCADMNKPQLSEAFIPPRSYRCRKVLMTGTLLEIKASLLLMREKIEEAGQWHRLWVLPLVQTTTTSTGNSTINNSGNATTTSMSLQFDNNKSNVIQNNAGNSVNGNNINMMQQKPQPVVIFKPFHLGSGNEDEMMTKSPSFNIDETDCSK